MTTADERPAARMYVAVDGTGVPMRPEETEGARGKQVDGGAKTREAKVMAIRHSEGRCPKTVRPKTAPGGRNPALRVPPPPRARDRPQRAARRRRDRRRHRRRGLDPECARNRLRRAKADADSRRLSRPGVPFRRPEGSDSGQGRAQGEAQGMEGNPARRRRRRDHRRPAPACRQERGSRSVRPAL